MIELKFNNKASYSKIFFILFFEILLIITSIICIIASIQMIVENKSGFFIFFLFFMISIALIISWIFFHSLKKQIINVSIEEDSIIFQTITNEITIQKSEIQVNHYDKIIMYEINNSKIRKIRKHSSINSLDFDKKINKKIQDLID